MGSARLTSVQRKTSVQNSYVDAAAVF
jgi:hypothetical protein